MVLRCCLSCSEGVMTVWEVLWRQDTSSLCFYCHMAEVLGVPFFRLMQVWASYVRRDFEILHMKGRLERTLIQKSNSGRVGIFTGCLGYPINVLNLVRLLFQPCLKFTRNLLKQTKRFWIIFLPHWIGIFLRGGKKKVSCWKNSNSSFRNRLSYKCLKAFLQCVIFCHKITSKSQLSSKTKKFWKLWPL